MDKCPDVEHLLVIPHLHVQNANAISSPHTHGFPSMTAFLGLMWALERKTQAAGLDLQFCAVGVVVHQHQELTTEDGFVKSFRLTRNPVGKDGKTAAIVEEGRIHLELSLVFAVQSDAWRLRDDPADKKRVANQVGDLIQQMRIAGGSIVPAQAGQACPAPYIETGSDKDGVFERIKLRLLPGFVLVERQDVLHARHKEMQKDNADASRLDAWLSLSRINYRWQEDDKSNGKWQHDREKQGWLVPIPLGYGALSELQAPGEVANARDPSIPFRFVESVYGIGQWLSPHRLHKAKQLLWYANSQPDNGLYRCRNDYRPMPVTDFD